MKYSICDCHGMQVRLSYCRKCKESVETTKICIESYIAIVDLYTEGQTSGVGKEINDSQCGATDSRGPNLTPFTSLLELRITFDSLGLCSTSQLFLLSTGSSHADCVKGLVTHKKKKRWRFVARAINIFVCVLRPDLHVSRLSSSVAMVLVAGGHNLNISVTLSYNQTIKYVRAERMTR